MFISDLNQKERGAFLELAQKIVCADGKITAEEREMLEALEEEAGEVERLGVENLMVFDICKIIGSKEARAKTMLELTSLAFVDGDYDSKEKELIAEIGKAWGIDRMDVLRSEDWGKLRVQLAAEAADIIREIST